MPALWAEHSWHGPLRKHLDDCDGDKIIRRFGERDKEARRIERPLQRYMVMWSTTTASPTESGLSRHVGSWGFTTLRG
jgi:hypothetical protein